MAEVHLIITSIYPILQLLTICFGPAFIVQPFSHNIGYQMHLCSFLKVRSMILPSILSSAMFIMPYVESHQLGVRFYGLKSVEKLKSTLSHETANESF